MSYKALEENSSKIAIDSLFWESALYGGANKYLTWQITAGYLSGDITERAKFVLEWITCWPLVGA